MRNDALNSANEKYGLGLAGVDAVLSAQKELVSAKLQKNKSLFHFHTNFAAIKALIEKN